MSETKIKICGMRREEDIRAVNEFRPDYAGFILAPGFRRTVRYETAKHLRSLLNPGITPVGVFVNSPAEVITEFVRANVIDVIQLHGDEEESYIDRLRYELKSAGAGKAVIMKVIRVRNEEDVRRAEASSADMILLDAGTGGGKTFDWHLACAVRRPFFLAGGLNPENVREAIRSVRPFGVDVSSGVETDGYKDREKIRDFIEKVRKEEEHHG